ncbi:MAG: SDR family oxidoreductase [Synechococcaceae cyanobacterium]|nr:SDR family oxidoreductase [Synechococcaceae cyanobacterium]
MESTDTGVLTPPGAVNPGGQPGLEGAAAQRAGIRRALVLGGGYSGSRFAAALAAAGIPVAVTHRRASASAPAPGPTELRFDAEEGILPGRDQLEGTSHLLVTIPPDRQGRDPVLEHLRPVLASLPLQWVGYLSSTGVYGDRAGGWVDETSPTRPGLERSQARLHCEQAWRASGLPLQVLRLPAIYGPGRSPFRSLREGTARMIHKPGQVFCRIHVDDIVGAILHGLALPPSRRPDTVNISDDAPCPSSETLGYAAHLLGCPLPPLQRYAAMESTLSPMARSFWSENRRVSNARLTRELGYRLRYPTYREGYRACLLEEGQAAGASDPGAG